MSEPNLRRLVPGCRFEGMRILSLTWVGERSRYIDQIRYRCGGDNRIKSAGLFLGHHEEFKKLTSTRWRQ